ELERHKQMLHSKEYKPKESLRDIAINNNVSEIKPKISVSKPSFTQKSENELFADLSKEPVKDNNPVHSFVEWAKKIF
ncbi:MAG: hypothetical protein KAU90_09800, partial [Sulfurovaceae bacterium]|nr:hypothetical protein [Sulfurovaceae bacterium]